MSRLMINFMIRGVSFLLVLFVAYEAKLSAHGQTISQWRQITVLQNDELNESIEALNTHG